MLRSANQKVGPGPLMGRQAFRGGYNSLILAGGRTGMSPDIWADEYKGATETPILPKQEPITLVRPAVEPCGLTPYEKQWCDFSGNKLPQCRKRLLPASDASCQPTAIECPLTDKVRKLCRPGYQGEYADFCMGISRNGACYDDFIRQEADNARKAQAAAEQKAKDDAAAKKREEEQAEQAWKTTRGCRYSKFPLEVGVNNNFIRTPCPWGSGDENKPGQIKLLGGQQYKFIGWSPERP